MASRALIGYQNVNTGAVTTLSIEQSATNSTPVFTEETVAAWAAANTPQGLVLLSVRYSPDYKDIQLTQ